MTRCARYRDATPRARVGAGSKGLGAAVLVALLAGSGARAQSFSEDGGFDVERFRPALDKNGIGEVESGIVGDNLTFDAAVVAGYELDPLVLVVSQGDARTVEPLIRNRATGDVVLSMSFFDWVELGVDAPFVLYQERATTFASKLRPVDLSPYGFGDVRVVSKIRVLRQRDGFVDVAVIPALTLPTALPAKSYFGDGGVGFDPEAVASMALGPARFAVDVQLRFRPEVQFLNLTVGPEVVTRAGFAWRFAGQPVELSTSVAAVTSLTAPLDRFHSGFEIASGVAWDLGRDTQVFASASLSLNAVYGMPTSRVVAGIRFSPRTYDRDGDGIDDADDKCPDDPEDKDGIEDQDGCPEVDADHDGVPDVSDKCPLVPEDRDGFEDADGCPDDDNDKDGIPDKEDRCPDVRGVPQYSGCPIPDSDGDGILDPEDQCPHKAGLRAYNGCPAPDSDDDGVPDSADLCPTIAGPANSGGCPDRDGDGVLDADDKCPDEPETINGVDDGDGCPDAGKPAIVVDNGEIRVLSPIRFEWGKPVIAKHSEIVVAELAAHLKAHREITRVRIEAGVGGNKPAGARLQLARDRANVLRDALVANGVNAGRIDAAGFADDAAALEVQRVDVIVVEDRGAHTKAAEPDAPSGSIDMGEVSRIVRGGMDGVRACVEENARTQDMPRKKQHLQFTIEPNGSVSKAHLTDLVVDESPLGVCIRRTAKRWKFPPFEGAASDVEIPLVLSVSQ